MAEKTTRTAGDAGWHVSRYNLMAPVPGTKMTAIANLFKGNCAEYTPIEMYLLSVLEELDEGHPIIELAEESGNELVYYPAPVFDSAVADERGRQVGLLCGNDASEISIKQEAGRFRAGHGHYCGAHNYWTVGIDDRGNLQKCWEAVDKPSLSFGTARDWDPVNPFATASCADNLTMYLNTAAPVPDAECRECVWLPLCVGGCPYKRLFDRHACIPFKDDPENYVLALHARIGGEKRDDALAEKD